MRKTLSETIWPIHLLDRRCQSAAALFPVILLLPLQSGLLVFAAGGPEDSRSIGPAEQQERMERRVEEFLSRHSDSTGRERPDLWRDGIEDTKRMEIVTTLPAGPSGALGAAGVGVVSVAWKQLGPAPIQANNNATLLWSGEVTDIAVDPRNSSDQTIYISVNDGGIWKSTDAGTTWAPKTDSMPSLSMGAVALDAANPSIVYAGTGNEFNNGFFKGVGVYTSVDGGDTWTVHNPAGIFNGVGINRIVSPAANVILVGTQQGLFRSANGGVSFGNNAPNFNNGNPVLAGNISDLKLDTASPATTMLAAVNGVGIFVSSDGGITFPSNILTAANTTPSIANFGNVTFDLSTTPDNQTLYANLQDTRAQTVPARPAPYPFLGLYKSVDGGTSWNQMAGANTAGNGCFCFYGQTVGVDPQNANRVYLGFIKLYRSEDGGGSFSNVSGPAHDDNHAITFSPRSHWGANPKTTFYVGNDGGIATSSDGAINVVNVNNGLATTLFRFMDMGRGSAANNAFTYGGLQDNGTIVRRTGAPGFPDLQWQFNSACCDGFGIAVAADPNIAFCSRNGGYNRTVNGGDSWSSPAGNGLPAIFMFAIDPSNNQIVYASTDSSSDGCTSSCFFSPGSQLWQSTDGGGTFTQIKTFPSPITAMATATGDSATFWVGLANGTVQRTANALSGATATWVPLTVTGAASLPIGGLALDPANAAQAVVVFQGLSGTVAGVTRHVFRTIDNGANWVNLSGTVSGAPTQNLPDLPLNAVVIDPGTTPHTIIVASDAAVLRSSDLGGSWQVLGAFLPTVQCTALALDSTATPSLLRVGTYGRSVFELVAADLPKITIPGDLHFADTCVGSTTYTTLSVCNTGTADLHVGPITSSDPQFTVVSPSGGYPVVISHDFCYPFQVSFTPTSVGAKTATISIQSNDPLNPTITLQASGAGTVPGMAVGIADSGSYGNVCLGDFKDLGLSINNSGGCDLSITGVTSSSTQFLLPNVQVYPMTVHAGATTVLPIRFQPTSLGFQAGTITVTSSIGTADMSVSGTAPPPVVSAPLSIDFGNVCSGGKAAANSVPICDIGLCNLHLTSIAFDPPCPDFTLGNLPSSFPAIVSHDFCLPVTVTFTPTSCGVKTCSLVITSDDPIHPTWTVTVTANSPCGSIGVPPDVCFAPTVIQSIGACTTASLFPISNKGLCPIRITSITTTRPYSLAGLPSFPINLQPGHTVGDGALSIVFAPTVLSRDTLGSISITYETDPVTHATTTVTRTLNGEGVRTGARVLVINSTTGLPVPIVSKLMIQRITGNRNKPILNTVDNALNLAPVTVTPQAPCAPFTYHREYSTVSNPIQLLPGSYQITATALVNGKKLTKAVGFDVSTCTFNPNIVISLP